MIAKSLLISSFVLLAFSIDQFGVFENDLFIQQYFLAKQIAFKANTLSFYHNERAGSVPFPKWMDPSWHNSIIGCICCQAVCPENAPFLKKVGKTAEFDDEETKLLLNGTRLELIPASALSKMKLLNLTDYYFNELPRNLTALLK